MSSLEQSHNSSKQFSAHISNPFGESGFQSGDSSKRGSGFEDYSFSGQFSNDTYTVSQSSTSGDIKELSGISFDSPPLAAPVSMPKKASPDYGHIDYSYLHSSPNQEFASSGLIQGTDGKTHILNQQSTPKKGTSSLDADFFQTAAASAFKQFGSATPSKTVFATPPKKTLGELTDATKMSSPAQSDAQVLGSNYRIGGGEKVN